MLSKLHQLLESSQDHSILALSRTNNKTVLDLKREVAALLLQCRSLQQQRVVLAFNNPWLHLVSMLACQQAGKTVVFPHNLAPATLSQYHQHAALMSDNHEATPDLLVSWSDTTRQVVDVRFQPIDAKSCQVELYTSGSTGTPKKITKPLLVFEREAAVLEREFGQCRTVTKVVGSVSHIHIYGFLFLMVWPLLSGRPFHTSMVTNPDTANALCDQQTGFVTSPVFIEHLNTAGSGLCAAKVFSSGGPLSYTASQGFRALSGLLPIEVFGSSETGGIAWRQACEADKPWQLLQGLSYSTSQGQLIVRSPFILPEQDYVTDDRVVAIDERSFRLLGRSDRVVKIAEKRISLTAIERLAATLPEVAHAVAVTIDTDTRKAINLAIVLSEVGVELNHSFKSGDWWRLLRQHLLKETESVALPRKVRVIEQIPYNNQGKINIQQIEELFV
ncbi:AMP-binding protein [Vibrio sp. 10N]|uniref:AMP-binding protein n=1 Tax=Vibrio sp. 10N TaxID=3058938 RepID=UPI0028141C91|nr:AMP-binding protein [Vibrio sp. 10N]